MAAPMKARTCVSGDVARAYLIAYAWEGANPAFTIERETTYAEITYIDFQQRHHGIAVPDGRYTVAVSADCRVVGARGTYVPKAALPQAWTADALEKTEQWRYLAIDGEQRLVYETMLGTQRALVDATTGKVVRQRSLSQGAVHGLSYHVQEAVVLHDMPVLQAGGATVEAFGYAYPQDPSVSTYEQVVLPRLLGDGSRLDGLYAKVWSERIGEVGVATPSLQGLDYRYPPSTQPASECFQDLSVCSHFDDVNAYYHIDRFAHAYWVNTLGVEINFQVHVATHLLGDGAFADWKRNLMKFQVGAMFMRNAALEDDILYHEYTHIVTGNLGFEVSIESDAETFALNEAYADYFSASFTNDPRVGEWLNTCPPRLECVGPPNDEEMRRLDTDPTDWNWNRGNPSDTLKYGVCTRFHAQDTKCKISWLNFSDQYVWSMIWSGALWDVRTELGAAITDQLVLTGLLYAHDTNLTFDEALEGLLLADQQLYNGQHRALLNDIFAERGIFRSGTEVRAEQPSPVNRLRFEQPYPNPAADYIVLRYALPQSSEISMALYDLTGRQLQQIDNGFKHAGSHEVTWDLGQLASGVYVVSVESKDTRLAHPVIVRR